MPRELIITRPDDWHIHLRDGAQLSAILPHVIARFARAIVMPNLNPPLVTTQAVVDYHARIRAALPSGAEFTPLMTLYLTENTTTKEIACARQSGIIHAVKFYPAGATTHSEHGVRDWTRIEPVLEAMTAHGLPLLIHGEVTDPEVDIFDRERVFIDRHLAPLVARHPGLKIVLEHITTQDAVDFVRAAPPTVAATITPHHLLLNRNALFQGGLSPYHYCLPVLKRETHRRALRAAAISANPKFFLGTDSAPHPRSAKEAAHACAGIYNAPVALELYAEIFAAENALDRLEGFASHYGADFYGLARNRSQLILEQMPWMVPQEYSFGDGPLIPFRAGEQIHWRIKSSNIILKQSFVQKLSEVLL